MDPTIRSDEDWKRFAASHKDADECALVLAAEGLSPRIARERGAWFVCVPAQEAERATKILAAYASENRRSQPLPSEPVFSDQALTGCAFSMGLFLFFLVTGPWSEATVWFARGSADSRSILEGELWRSVTALTLHADLAHVLGNAIAAALFVTAVCRGFGPGLGCALVLVAGAVGNLANAWLRGGLHASVGAPTAVFGAVGLLGGVGLVRWRQRGGRGRRSWSPVAAALALLAMLGSAGERVDFGAHVLGLLAGLALGVLVARTLTRPLGVAFQWGLAGAAIAALVLCWALALSIPSAERSSEGIHEDRRGPGALLDRGEAIVVGIEERPTGVARSGAHTAPVLVALTSQRIPVDRGRWLLNRRPGIPDPRTRPCIPPGPVHKAAASRDLR
jgi:membrane associated rhomboid family serine protease